MAAARRFPAWLVMGALLAGCQTLPDDLKTQLAGSGAAGPDQPAGDDTVGEACRFHPASPPSTPDYPHVYDLYCGTWQQPSGRVYEAGGAGRRDLDQLARAGAWRNGLDQRYACNAPSDTSIAGGAPAALLKCVQHNLNIPHVAFVADVGEHIYYADGIPSALPALEATISVASGGKVPEGGARSSAAAQIAAAIGAKPFGSGDLDDYYTFMRLGNEANGAGDYASAEKAFRNALAVQQRILGADDPGLTTTITHLALQLSNQHHFNDANELFHRADKLSARLHDPLIASIVQLYEAEHLANQGKYDLAADGAARLERGFANLVPEQILHGDTSTRSAASLDTVGASLTLSPDEQTAVTALAEVWRFQSYLAYKAGDLATVEHKAVAVRALVEAAGIEVPGVVPRSVRLAALGRDAGGQHDLAAPRYTVATDLFQKAGRGDRPQVETMFLAARNATTRGDAAQALALYRAGTKLAQEQHVAINETLIDEYLLALEAETERTPPQAEALAAEAFEAMQLAQGGQASQVVAKALARLATDDPGARANLRIMQDADLELDRLTRERDQLSVQADTDAGRQALTQIDQQIAATQGKRNEAEQAIQAASPGYAQLVSHGATAAEIQPLLRDGEGLLSFEGGAKANHAVLISRDHALLWHIGRTKTELAQDILALRKTITLAEGADSLPDFDVAGANQLYETLLGPGRTALDGLKRLVVVPNEPLTNLPLEVLVTEPGVKVARGDYGKVPFLVEKLALSYIPSAQNFVLLRSHSKPSAAAAPYIGFGDFRPASKRQLQASFPASDCAQDLAELEVLPPLPGTEKEIAYIGSSLFRAPARDLVMGGDFVRKRLAGADLSGFRVVHLATHALLPTDLTCRAEPTLVLSTPATEPNADGAFFGISDILSMKLDADLVVLSACNTGPNGQSTGDSLSGLARAFFFVGARGLLVTHWELEDHAGPLLAALTLDPRSGTDSAVALRRAQLSLIHDIARKSGVFFTHPYIWAPFVLIGDGIRAPAPAS